ncbi:MAG: phospholipid carrier-dependent glycosyltransferase [Nanoarchaeota archaeon]|nr:phospholipid carrier-dependent glycosyltransferase [Nanoarchaeota archaeon]
MLSVTSRSFAKEKIYLAIIFALSVFGTYSNYLILAEDTQPLVYDQTVIHAISTAFFKVMAEGDADSFFRLYLNYNYGYPPLVAFQAIPAYYLFGISQDIHALSNSAYILIMLLAIYFLGKKMISTDVGMISSVLVFSMPYFLPSSRVILPDFGHSSLIVAAIAALLYSDCFEDASMSLVFGAAAGLAMLMRFTAVIYILPFLAILIWKQLSHRRRLGKNMVHNIALAGIPFLILISLWYPFNTSILLQNTEEMAYYSESISRSIPPLERPFMRLIGYNTGLMRASSMYYALLAFFISVGLLVDSFGRNKTLTSREFIAAAAAPLIPLLGFLPSVRYLFPLIPLLSIAAVAGAYWTYTSLVDKKMLKPNPAIFICCSLSVILVLPSISPAGAQNSFDLLNTPMKIDSKESEISSIIHNIIQDKDIAAPKVLLMQDSSTAFNLVTRLGALGYSVQPLTFCIAESQAEDFYSYCRLNRAVSANDFCSYDLIVDSDRNLNEPGLIQLKEAFPERAEYLAESLETIGRCKPGYTLATTVKNVPSIEYDKRGSGEVVYSDLYIYARK